MPAAQWARPTVNACCVGSASRIASASYSAASANRPSWARLMTSQAAIVDRCRRGDSEILVDPVGGQRREVVGGQLDHPLVLAPVGNAPARDRSWSRMRSSQVPEAPGDLQRAGAGRERLVQLAEQRVDVRHERADPASPAVVVQPLGEGLGLAQALQRPPDFTELVQHRPQLEADLEGLLQRGLALRQRLEDAERLLEPDPGVRERRPRGRLELRPAGDSAPPSPAARPGAA